MAGLVPAIHVLVVELVGWAELLRDPTRPAHLVAGSRKGSAQPTRIIQSKAAVTTASGYALSLSLSPRSAKSVSSSLVS